LRLERAVVLGSSRGAGMASWGATLFSSGHNCGLAPPLRGPSPRRGSGDASEEQSVVVLLPEQRLDATIQIKNASGHHKRHVLSSTPTIFYAT
jgi:hypothetical protein